MTPADRAEAAAALAEDDRPLVVLHPGANDPRRRWPVERLAVVGSELAGKGARLAVVGTASERGLVDRLLDGLDGDAADLAGRLGLGGLAGLLEQAALLVGNDSGPRHLAAAVGTATVAIHWGVSLGSLGRCIGPGTGPRPPGACTARSAAPTASRKTAGHAMRPPWSPTSPSTRSWPKPTTCSQPKPPGNRPDDHASVGPFREREDL